MALATSMARTRVDDTLLQALPSRLTRRDRYLLRLLYEHDVLTTTHLCDVGFATRRRATYRLAQLYGLRLIDRVRPLVTRGSGEHHWVLDEAGAVVVAAERGLTRRELGWRREEALALASGGQRLEHLAGVNGFFVGLLKTSRRQPGARLSVWWSERRCAAEWGDLVRPDGYGVWTEAGNTVAFALEYDRGTERPAERLAAKLPGYQELMAEDVRPNWLLVAFISERHEQVAREALATSTLPIATATVRTGTSPTAPIWQPLDGDYRVALCELSCRP